MHKIVKQLYIAVIVLSIRVIVNGEMEGFIVHGEDARIEDFPHVAYLAVMCDTDWSCGSSILNQDIIITAAHCFDNCPKTQTTVGIIVGKEEVTSSFDRFAAEFIVHEQYDKAEMNNDIALVRVDWPLEFTKTVKKIAIQSNLNYGLVASIAGWGLIDEEFHTRTKFLQKTEQKVWFREDCEDLLGALPWKAFCAGYQNKNHGYAAVGDSGSGLVVDSYILIGIVSYKLPTISSSVAVYTNVASFYTWIMCTSAKLYCQE